MKNEKKVLVGAVKYLGLRADARGTQLHTVSKRPSVNTSDV